FWADQPKQFGIAHDSDITGEDEQPPLMKVKVNGVLDTVKKNGSGALDTVVADGIDPLPAWTSSLTPINQQFIRSFMDREQEEIEIEIEGGKKKKKHCASLLLEILITVFNRTGVFEMTGPVGAFQCSIVCGTTTVSSDPHKNKKDAKVECAQQALQTLLTARFWADQAKQQPHAAATAAVAAQHAASQASKAAAAVDIPREGCCRGCSMAARVERPRADDMMRRSLMSNLIQEHSYALFHKLTANNPQAANTHRVLAAIFLHDLVENRLHCVSLATGNKGIKASNLSLEGRSVNDCHAEVLARRGFVRWLYAQVQLACTDKRRSALFWKAGEQEGETSKLKLRAKFDVHLFISTAPCGDGRVYQFDGCGNKDYRNVGRLRHKIEDGEGTVLGTKDEDKLSIESFAMGQRLRTMSCSDKVLKWNVLGLQGSLLSNFMHPIYLSSLTLAHFTRQSCVARACYGRVAGLALTEKGYRVNSELQLNSSTWILPAPHHGRPKSVNVSANWNSCDGKLELIDTRTGRVLGVNANEDAAGATSRLAKISFLSRFAAVTPGEGPVEYWQAKRSATAYRRTLAEFLHYLEHEAKLGSWQSKPDDYWQAMIIPEQQENQ
ncbi:hypothetical protein PFISCL1PPCAC_8815, partial [Pristionchus fissidentatus]